MHEQSSAHLSNPPAGTHIISSRSLLRSGEVHARYRVLKDNTDLLDRLVDVPMTREECGQVLAYYMMQVVAMSPADDVEYVQARRELSALLQHDLDATDFYAAARLGWNIHCRAADYPLADGYEMWSDDDLAKELTTCIEDLLYGMNR